MGFNFLSNIQYCGDFVEGVGSLLSYTHVLSAVSSLAIATFVLIRSRYSNLSRILFLLALSFSFWVLSNLIIWKSYANSLLIVGAWSQIEIWSLLIYFFFFYFTYAYTTGKRLPASMHTISLSLLLIAAYFALTGRNILWFDAQECIVIEPEYYQFFLLVAKSYFVIATICVYVAKFLGADRSDYKQLFFSAIGTILFLFSFIGTGYISEITENFIYEALGLIGMVVFVGFLGFLIVKYQMLNVKIIAAEALVIAMTFFSFAGLFYVSDYVDFFLTLLQFILISVAGLLLILNVRGEVRQREKIQALADKLTHANAQLQDLDRQKDELLSLVSHQLAKPITAIKWGLESLLDGDSGTLNASQKEAVNSTQAMATTMADLVGMILDVSRIQLGKIHLDPQPLDLGTLVTELMAMMKVLAEHRKITLSCSLSPTKLPVVSLDRRYMRMVLENLLTNAIKYTPEGGTVHFRLQVAGGWMRCQVQDTGCGIPKKEQAKIFGKMYRASNVRNTIEGNGFGLYIAKGAVEAQGGTLRFESDEGKGTTFFVDVPITPAKA